MMENIRQFARFYVRFDRIPADMGQSLSRFREHGWEGVDPEDLGEAMREVDARYGPPSDGY